MNEYDIIADRYDDLFVDKCSKNEDAITSKLLGNLYGVVCDIGCGTGLLLEMKRIAPENYCGIDPSEGMLAKFEKKHPNYITIDKTFENWYDGWNGSYRINNFVSLYGSISYVSKDYVKRLAGIEGNKFLMFYADDYTPYTHTITGINPPFSTYSKKELRSIFGDRCAVYRFNNYFIVQTI